MNDYQNEIQKAAAFQRAGAGSIQDPRQVGEIEREMNAIGNLIERISTNADRLRNRIDGVCRRPIPMPAEVGRNALQGAPEPTTQSGLGDQLAQFRRQLEVIQRTICDTTDSIVL
jgi:hypothetical protein